MSKIKGIFIYIDYPSRALSISEIVDYLERYGLKINLGRNLLEALYLTNQERLELAKKISGSIIRDINLPNEDILVTNYEETNLEHKRLSGEKSYLGVFYDGNWLQRILFKFFSSKFPGKTSSDFIHIIFTSRLFGTFENKRYHARVILMGTPTIISTSGIVEAPARPREYYWLKAGFIQSGKDLSALDQIYKGRFVGYDDTRITTILGAYALQSIVYEITGKEFCENPSCCLYNSHWQEDVLKAQLNGIFCREHQETILRIPNTVL
jgi:hypothetical protein